MSEENLATVGPIYEGWAGGASAADLGALVDPQIDVHPDPRSARAGIEASYRLVLAIERGRRRFSGALAEIRHTAHIWTLRDGRAVRLDVNWDREQAFAELDPAAR